MKRSALICGAGIAGCALGALLADRGWRVTLVERRTADDTAGFTFTMQRPGWRTLEELGLQTALRAQGYPLPWLAVVSSSGAVLRRVKDVDTVMAGAVQLFRSEVNAALRARAAACELVTGTSVTSYRVDGDGVVVELEGSAAPRRVTLLVGADGVRSRVRALAGLGEAVEGDTWSVNLLGPSRGPGFQARHGKGSYLIIAPTRRPESNWVLTTRGVPPPDDDGPALRAALGDGLRAVGEEVRVADEAVSMRLVHNLEVHADAWSRDGRVVLVGDAAHGMWHSAGVGGSLALGDATALARLLDAHAVSDALHLFEAERRWPVRRALTIAHRSMQMNLPTSPLVAWLRDLAVRVVPVAAMAPAQIDT